MEPKHVVKHLTCKLLGKQILMHSKTTATLKYFSLRKSTQRGFFWEEKLYEKLDTFTFYVAFFGAIITEPIQNSRLCSCTGYMMKGNLPIVRCNILSAGNGW